MKQKIIRVSAVVLEALRNNQFFVRLESGEKIRAYLSGRMNKYKIRVIIEDKVIVELSPKMSILNQVGRIVLRK
jgi:translation initiation factor IF-1